MASALERLRPGAEATCLVDGFSLRDCTVPHRAVIEGDGTSAAIAAASVIAKVTRDRYMHGAGRDHPGWGFEEHVGYSTPEHREAIERIGISPLHRRSFQSVAYSPAGAAPARTLPRMCSTSIDAAGAVEGDADGVEADLGVARRVAAFAHPGGGEAADALLLAAVDAEDRALGAEGGVLAAGLDLDEDERAAVEGDDVELAEAGAGVALDDLPA